MSSTLVTSASNPLLVAIRKAVADPGSYRKSGWAWVEGEHLCEALLQRVPQAISAVVVAQSASTRPAVARLMRPVERQVVVADALMAGLTTMDSPPPMGMVMDLRTWGEHRPAGIQPHAPTLILDRVQDAGNAGTLMRSASAMGFEQVLAIKGSTALWAPKVLRAGMGAHFTLQVIEGLDISALDELKVPLLGTTLARATPLHLARLPWPCAWVLGHEGQGVSDTLLARCAQRLRIEQPGGEESLNVSAAAAICFYESARQRLTARGLDPQ